MKLGINMILQILMAGTIIPQIRWINPYLIVSLWGKLWWDFGHWWAAMVEKDNLDMIKAGKTTELKGQH